MTRLIFVVVTCLFLVGCSGTETQDRDKTVTTVSAEYRMETDTGEAEESSLSVRGRDGSRSKPAIALSKSESLDDSTEEVADKPIVGKQTKMHLTIGTERIWQNGPTPEEVARATTVKEAPPISYDEIGNGAPMMDPHAELSEIRR